MKCPRVKRVLQWSWDGIANGNPHRCIAPLKPDASRFRNMARHDKKLDPKLCNDRSKYTVNGLHYCRKHAGAKVLDLCDATAGVT